MSGRQLPTLGRHTDFDMQPCDIERQRQHPDLAGLDGQDEPARFESVDCDGDDVLVRRDLRKREAARVIGDRLSRPSACASPQHHRGSRQRGAVRGRNHLALHDRIALRRSRADERTQRDQHMDEKNDWFHQSAIRNAIRSAFSCAVKRAWNRVS